MVWNVDLIQKEVKPPISRWCCAGHIAPEIFKRQGPNSSAEPTRFFLIQGHQINGIFCEPCLIIANWLSFNKRKLMPK